MKRDHLHLLYKLKLDAYSLPNHPDLRMRVNFGQPSDQEKQELDQLMLRVNDVYKSVQTFCLVHYGKDSDYYNGIRAIHLTPHYLGMPINTTFEQAHINAWIDGISKMRNFIEDLIRIIEHELSIQESDLDQEPNINPIPNIQQNITISTNDNSDPPSKTWQIIAVIFMVVIFILGLYYSN